MHENIVLPGTDSLTRMLKASFDFRIDRQREVYNEKDRQRYIRFISRKILGDGCTV